MKQVNISLISLYLFFKILLRLYELINNTKYGSIWVTVALILYILCLSHPPYRNVMFHPLSHTSIALPSAPLETTASFCTAVYLTLFYLCPHRGMTVIRDVTSRSCLVSSSKMFLRLDHLAIKDRRFSLEENCVQLQLPTMFSPFIRHSFFHLLFASPSLLL